MLVLGLVACRPAGRALAGACSLAGLAALAGGGYWYLRNLVHTGNPLPWIHHLGPISLPAPEQALGGREAHSVLGYLTDGSVWSDWFLPGLHHGLWILWPLLGAAALAGLVLASSRPRSWPIWRPSERTAPWRAGGSRDSVLALAPASWGSPRRSPGWSPRPRPRAPTACRGASSPACATSPRPWSSASPCSRPCPARCALACRPVGARLQL